MVVQGVQSNYDTDVFTPIIREIEHEHRLPMAVTNQQILPSEWLQTTFVQCPFRLPMGNCLPTMELGM